MLKHYFEEDKSPSSKQCFLSLICMSENSEFYKHKIFMREEKKKRRIDKKCIFIYRLH